MNANRLIRPVLYALAGSLAIGARAVAVEPAGSEAQQKALQNKRVEALAQILKKAPCENGQIKVESTGLNCVIYYGKASWHRPLVSVEELNGEDSPIGILDGSLAGKRFEIYLVLKELKGPPGASMDEMKANGAVFTEDDISLAVEKANQI